MKRDKVAKPKGCWLWVDAGGNPVGFGTFVLDNPQTVDWRRVRYAPVGRQSAVRPKSGSR